MMESKPFNWKKCLLVILIAVLVAGVVGWVSLAGRSGQGLLRWVFPRLSPTVNIKAKVTPVVSPVDVKILPKPVSPVSPKR